MTRAPIVIDDAVDRDTLRTMREQVSRSRLVGASQLVGGFQATRGFGVTFRRDALDDVRSRFSWCVPVLARVLHDSVLGPLRAPCSSAQRLVRRVLGGHVPNAFYANVLVVGGGAGVDRHVDATLGTLRPGPPRTPLVVGVLYLDVPDGMRGGRLRVWGDDDVAQEIEPRVGRFVAFAGNAGHAVTPVQLSPEVDDARAAVRVSVVVEAYAFDVFDLRAVPRLRVQSNGFADVLHALRVRDDDTSARV